MKQIQADQDKLKKESFNADRFLNELADAYDTVIARSVKKTKNAALRLNDVYLRLAPTARAKKEYSKQAYAFDLARLYVSDLRVTKDGRTLDLGNARENKGAIRFLDQNGLEHYFTTISFI